VSLAPARSLVAISDHVSFSEAAATWVAYGAGWAGLVAIGKLAAGQTVLIPAASSSVGIAAIQIASRLRARPIALTRTSAKASALLGHGAAAVIATAEQDVAAEVKRLTDNEGAHLVFDPVGGSAFQHLVRATRNGGVLILYGALATDPTALPPFDIFARDLTIRGLALPGLARDGTQLAALKRFVSDGLADGTLRPTIARTFAFDQIADAHRFIEAGDHIGKVVVTL
jgi:NADPH:quinone reductase-like Zn-dependent oxidoreductase